MTFKLHPEARAEYREAIMFYGRAAEKFTNAIETVIAEIIRRPGFSAPKAHENLAQGGAKRNPGYTY